MEWNKNGSRVFLQQSPQQDGLVNEDVAINYKGQSVGCAGGQAVLWSAAGVETDLVPLLGSPAPGWLDTEALGINNAGDIFGSGELNNGNSEAWELIWHPATSADTTGHYTAVEHHNILAASAFHTKI